jgi:uncharacterized protein YlxW (UPF0749 family)
MKPFRTGFGFLLGGKHGPRAFENGDRFEGEWKAGLPDGAGTCSTANGDRYEGDWKAGVKEGKGTLFYASGDRYEGDWKAGVKEGWGTYFSNFRTDYGSRYEGYWKADVRETWGTEYHADGSRYAGEWKADMKEGRGTYSNRYDRYEGDWKEGVREGQGREYFANGDRCEGVWKADVKEGKITYFYASGDRYEGDWKADAKEGKGTLFFTDGSRYEGDWKADVKEGMGLFFANGFRYEGDWKADVREGKGTFFFAGGVRFEGDWTAGVWEGQGTYYTAVGARYEGDWKAGVKEGKGTDFYANGDRYEGDWKAGVREGKGTESYADGDRYEGDWKAGVKEGKGIYFYADGARYEGDWKAGVKEGKGTQFYVNGDRYDGDWVANRKEGRGVFCYANGCQFEAVWIEDNLETATSMTVTEYLFDKQLELITEAILHGGELLVSMQEANNQLQQKIADLGRKMVRRHWMNVDCMAVLRRICTSYEIGVEHSDAFAEKLALHYMDEIDEFNSSSARARAVHSKMRTLELDLRCYSQVLCDLKNSSLQTFMSVLQAAKAIQRDQTSQICTVVDALADELSTVRRTLRATCQNLVRAPKRNNTYLQLIFQSTATDWKQTKQRYGLPERLLSQGTEDIDEFDRLKAQERDLRDRINPMKRQIACYAVNDSWDVPSCVEDEIDGEGVEVTTRDQATQVSTASNEGIIVVTRSKNECSQSLVMLESQLREVRENLESVCQTLVRAFCRKSIYVQIIFDSTAVDWNQTKLQYGLQDKLLSQSVEDIEEFERLKLQERHLTGHINTLKKEVRCCECMLRDLYDEI